MSQVASESYIQFLRQIIDSRARYETSQRELVDPQSRFPIGLFLVPDRSAVFSLSPVVHTTLPYDRSFATFGMSLGCSADDLKAHHNDLIKRLHESFKKVDRTRARAHFSEVFTVFKNYMEFLTGEEGGLEGWTCVIKGSLVEREPSPTVFFGSNNETVSLTAIRNSLVRAITERTVEDNIIGDWVDEEDVSPTTG